MDIKKIALFAAGTLFGSAGFKLLSSKDAKKVYTQTTAAVLRMKDSTMETVSKVQEQAGDILADAKAINEARAAKAEAELPVPGDHYQLVHQAGNGLLGQEAVVQATLQAVNGSIQRLQDVFQVLRVDTPDGSGASWFSFLQIRQLLYLQ